MKKTLSIALIVGLATIVTVQPWQQIKESMGIVTAMDSLMAMPATLSDPDSLMVQSVAITLPDIISDSLSYTVRSREKKKVYLEEQSAWLEQYNQRLDLRLKAQKQAMRQKEQSLRMAEQTPMDAMDLNGLLTKQNPASRHDVRSLGVSDMASEMLERDTNSSQGPSSQGPSSRKPNP